MLALVLFILLGEAAIVLQMALPDFFFVLGDRVGTMLPKGGEPQLVILALVAASMTLGDWRALIVAVVLGFSFDLNTENRIGIAILCFSAITALLISQANTKLGRHLLYQILLVLVATFLYQILYYIMVSIQLWRWRMSLNVWSIIVISSLLNAALYAVIGLGVKLLHRRRNHQPDSPATPAYAHRT